MGLYPIPNITDYLSTAWANKIPSFPDVVPWDKLLLLFWNLHVTHADEQGKFKK
jgi:hypothetical protein